MPSEKDLAEENVTTRGEVLVAILNNLLDFAVARDRHWYRIPVSSHKWLKDRWPPEWLAFYQTKVFGSEVYAVNYYTRVLDVRQVVRVESNTGLGVTMEGQEMPALTLELSPEVYHRLYEEAARVGKSPQVIVQEWLTERLASPIASSGDDRERACQTLRAAGLLAELGPNLRDLADPTVRLEDITAALDRAKGKTLSQIVLEQRGPKG